MLITFTFIVFKMFQCFMILKSLCLNMVNLCSEFRKKSFATLHRNVAIGVVLLP